MLEYSIISKSLILSKCCKVYLLCDVSKNRKGINTVNFFYCPNCLKIKSKKV